MQKKFALFIFVISLILSSAYYFTKHRSFEQYVIRPLSSEAGQSRKLQVHLNLASEREFDNLPGVGPALAKRIVEDRERNGRFHSVEELSRVKGIGEKKFAKIRPFVTTLI